MSETRDERRTLGRHGHHATFDPGCISCWRIEATKRGDDGRELSDFNRALQKELDALRTQLQQAETALRFYADPENWEGNALYHYGTGPEDGPETIAERALAAPPPNTKEGESVRAG